jgi:hypothetical protein
MNADKVSSLVAVCFILLISFGVLAFLALAAKSDNESLARCEKICRPNAVWEHLSGSCTCDLTKVVK